MKIAIASDTLQNNSEFVEWCASRMDLTGFVGDADIIVLGTNKISYDYLRAKAIIKYGVGTDNIDFAACKERGITVHYKKGTNADAVAELTLSYVIQLLRNQHLSAAAARRGEWLKAEGKELGEATIGVLGCGAVGGQVMLKIERITGEYPAGHDIHPDWVEWESLAEVLACDVVTLHIDNDGGRNNGFIDDDKLSQMRDGAYLVNTSRGAVIDYDALERHLPRLGGVALDVYPDEPRIPEFLRASDKAILSCHIGGSSERAIPRGIEFVKETISCQIHENAG